MYQMSDIILERGYLASPFQVKFFGFAEGLDERSVRFRYPVTNKVPNIYDFYAKPPERKKGVYMRNKPIFAFESDGVFEISEFKEQYTERSQFICEYLIHGDELLEQHSIVGTFNRLPDAKSIFFPINDICFEKHGNDLSVAVYYRDYLLIVDSPKEYWRLRPEQVRKLDIEQLLKDSKLLGYKKL